MKKKILNLKNDVRPGINSFSLIKSDFYRVTHKGGGFNDDLKILIYSDMKVEFDLFPWLWSESDLLNDLATKENKFLGARKSRL